MKKEINGNSRRKMIKLTLVGLDGNAYSLLGAFSRQARREGWTKAEIDEVLKEAMSGDYNHLLATLSDRRNDTDETEDV